MRISDWSSDVCSSDLAGGLEQRSRLHRRQLGGRGKERNGDQRAQRHACTNSRSTRHAAPHDSVRSWNDIILNHDRGAGCAPSVVRRQQPSRSEEHTSELQSLLRSTYVVFCLKTTTSWYTSS